MKKFLAFLSCIFLFLTASGQKNLTMLGHLPFPGKTSAGVWHYADNGNEYALVGTSTGLAIVNVTVPSVPVLITEVPGNNSLWREVKTYQHYAYVTTEGGGGVTIINLDSLPLAVSYKYFTGNDTITGLLDRAHTLQVEGDYLYLNGASNFFPGGVLIFSLADPWNPVLVGSESFRYSHDCYVRNDTMWVSEIGDGQFSVYDITNKAAPVLIVSQPTPGAFNHNAWLSDDGNYLFTTDELPYTPLGVFDVSDLSNIQLVDVYYTNMNPTAEVHNVRVLNDFLINPSYGNTTYNSQLTICDAARPHNIIETADFPISAPGVGLKLAWDASPYLPSGNIIVTDVDSGLYILAPTYVRGCYLEGVVTDSITGVFLNNVLVEILATPVTESTIFTGEYKTGLADPGTYSVKFSKSGYIPKTINNVVLTNGVLTVLDVQLWDGTVGIDETPVSDAKITATPNPFNETTTITIPREWLDKHLTLTVRDVAGRLIISHVDVQQENIVIDGKGLEKGIYFYEVIAAGKLIQSGKLILD